MLFTIHAKYPSQFWTSHWNVWPLNWLDCYFELTKKISLVGWVSTNSHDFSLGPGFYNIWLFGWVIGHRRIHKLFRLFWIPKAQLLVISKMCNLWSLTLKLKINYNFECRLRRTYVNKATESACKITSEILFIISTIKGNFYSYKITVTYHHLSDYFLVKA